MVKGENVSPEIKEIMDAWDKITGNKRTEQSNYGPQNPEHRAKIGESRRTSKMRTTRSLITSDKRTTKE